jgi:hypothetical protein
MDARLGALSKESHMATKQQALAAARRKWGKRAFVRENKRAMTPSQREQHKAHVRSLKARLDELEVTLKANRFDWKRLLEAAEFCVAVNSQEPSFSELKDCSEQARVFQDLLYERKLVRDEWERIRYGGHTQRWDAGYVADAAGMQFVSIHAQADTLDELIRKIEPLKNEQLV